MTSNLVVVQSTSAHVRELWKTLREKDRKEAVLLGVNPEKATFFAYRHACYKKTALVDGKVAAMWGLHGELLGSTGHPYLMTGIEAEKVSPTRFARLYKEEVQVMRTLFPILENYVDATYEQAVRLLKIAGFSLSESVFVNGNPFLKFRLES